jgi:hypothetical protein
LINIKEENNNKILKELNLKENKLKEIILENEELIKTKNKQELEIEKLLIELESYEKRIGKGIIFIIN